MIKHFYEGWRIEIKRNSRLEALIFMPNSNLVHPVYDLSCSIEQGTQFLIQKCESYIDKQL